MSESEKKKRKLGDEVEAKPEVLGAGTDDKRLPSAPEAAPAEPEKDANVVELQTKVSHLVKEKFGGDYKKAFDHYDSAHSGAVGKDEIVSLLKDANVGNGFTRSTWASKIIEKMDSNHDGKVQWSEFEAGIKG